MQYFLSSVSLDADSKMKEIEKLFNDFVEAAKPLVKQIVEEFKMPPEQRKFLPIKLGGLAGGK